MQSIWDPQRQRRELFAEVNRAFRAARQREELGSVQPNVHPPLDFVTTDAAYLVLVDLPGVTRENIDVLVERGALTIRGKKIAAAGNHLLRREREYGPFARLVPLPDDADLADVRATLKAGELVVRIGRRPGAQPRRVEVVEE
ncbi:MAG: Hsp20/alpha crystallin family protein [Armatimonadetes bacterium]|nr:Hsp20/alpha crystallin family protein [Armatimonadota bacterium]